MSAQGVWTGLADSAFLAEAEERERDPARLATTLLGGFVLGVVASTCGLLIILVAYALLMGEGARGLAALSDAARSIGDDQSNSAALTVLRLVTATAVDGAFLLVFVAAGAAITHQPMLVYITSAPAIRWRLLAVAMALAAAAMAPLVVAQRLLTAGAPPPPFLGVSSLTGDRLVYVVSSLLLIPAAAAEELFFRGWLMRQTGAFLRRPLLLIAITSLLFSALHFDFNPDAFLTRALMGAGFAYMTLRLGGIEFPTGVHAVNNMLIVLFLQPLTVEQTAGADISAFSLVGDLALIGAYVTITELVARLPALRRLAGVRVEDISPSHSVSANFS